MEIEFKQDEPSCPITPPHNGAHWMQGIEYFDAQFQHIPSMSGAGVDPETRARMTSRGQATNAVDLSGYAKIPEEIDFLAWMNGEIKLKWFVVTASILAHHGKQVSTREQAIEHLCEELGIRENEDTGKFFYVVEPDEVVETAVAAE